MRPVLVVCVCSALGTVLWAQDAEPRRAKPKVFFRQPDPVTEKRIENDLISGNGIGAGTKDQRAMARAELEVLDAWAVPYLARALHGRKADGAHTIRMNAAATLARILDPRALPELRGAASTDKSRWVRRTSLLSLGLFRQPEDVILFTENLNRRQEKRRHPAAALALGKIPDVVAGRALVQFLNNPPSDEHLLGAILLAASIRSPDAPIRSFLSDKRRLIQRIAAACLQVRRLEPGDLEDFMRVIERGRYREVRELQFWALGAIPERTPEIRAELLECAIKSKYKSGARVAALTSLAYEWNVKGNYEKLAKLYSAIKGRNDPKLNALMFAMARSGHEDSIRTLLGVVKRGPAQRCFYASASLFHVIALAPGEHPRTAEITSTILRQRSRIEDPHLLKLIDLVARWASPPEGTKDRAAIAREGFREIGDPKNLHLFDWTRDERAWEIVNAMVPQILELDKLVGSLTSPESNPGKAPEPKPGSDGKDELGSEEELDLLNFLNEKPYYVPADRAPGKGAK